MQFATRSAACSLIQRRPLPSKSPSSALKPAEWDMLLHDLLACDLPYTCPHGRPTMIQLSLAELDKKFGRMQ